MMFYELSAFDPTDLTFNPMWRQGLYYVLPGTGPIGTMTRFFTSSLPSDRGRLRATVFTGGLVQLVSSTVAPLLRFLLSAASPSTGPALLLLRAFAWWPAVRMDPVPLVVSSAWSTISLTMV
jgi:hypothetical protein